MPLIRIREKNWEEVWPALLDVGPFSRVEKDYVYDVSDEHVEMLRRRKLPFEQLNSSVSQRSKPRAQTR